jgi:uncharacterized small protein (DUF1192 family)
MTIPHLPKQTDKSLMSAIEISNLRNENGILRAELSRLKAERERDMRKAWDASRRVVRQKMSWGGDPHTFADHIEAEEDNAFAAFLSRKEKGE